MKTKINNIDVECSVNEFFELSKLLNKKEDVSLSEGVASVVITQMATDIKRKKYTSNTRKSSCLPWTKEDIEVIKTNNIHKAKKLLKNRTYEAIYCKRSSLGLGNTPLKKPNKEIYKVNSDRLKKVHADSKLLADQLGISVSKAFQMLIKNK